jgi:hypothetical protein
MQEAGCRSRMQWGTYDLCAPPSLPLTSPSSPPFISFATSSALRSTLIAFPRAPSGCPPRGTPRFNISSVIRG